ncbi:hypothetical protein SAMN05216257_10665 [Meinhardsimonia xiamenensis]|jgi:hypothetical protein|uniref:Tellurite resistance protein n=1 Tax=Meinhardsimonia xiamenensis TaxID=990712 RepID=A0A1G9G266_9RHOB|nr:TrgA family protein [Meinhardsimonia xiamenensis]PRX32712.1 hypothetical protein LV81_02473 [Meinhardsimonia xiamenensis]SDK94715.1 hypothetical protein SAMN05216257_10665 [Meinhardsimonia xiamenensis]
MPTAAKLVAALAFAAIGYLAAARAVATLPENAEVGLLREIIAAFGLLLGWKLLGPAAESRLTVSLAAGLTTAVALAVVGVFFVAVYQMLVKSMHNFYKGPMQALESVFDLAWERGQVLTDPVILVILLGGGLVAGALARGAARLWR